MEKRVSIDGASVTFQIVFPENCFRWMLFAGQRPRQDKLYNVSNLLPRTYTKKSGTNMIKQWPYSEMTKEIIEECWFI
jgi:hypothetical protein